MIAAVVVSAVVGSVLDVAVELYRTPLGWSAGMIIGLFAISALSGVLIALPFGTVFGLPVGRLLAREGKFKPAALMIVGALIGALVAILLSAVGDTYMFMAGFAFWKALAVDTAMGAVSGLFWWIFEKRRISRTQD